MRARSQHRLHKLTQDSRLHRTTEPYVLPPRHPLRRVFARTGGYVTQHSARFILLSLAASIALSYPLLSQLRNHAADLYLHVPALQSHAWTSVQPYRKAVEVPDLVVRQVWFHGDYMSALCHDILEGASIVQNNALGLATQCDQDVSLHRAGDVPSAGKKSFFHSPLVYWTCSLDKLQRDRDLLRTINDRSQQRSPANLTLKPSSVLAGKSFDSGQLIAADALVLSFFYEPNDNAGHDWTAKSQIVSSQEGWHVYGNDSVHRNYELRYQPLNFLDYTLLFLCYGFMIAYLLTNLIGLRILRSRLGLITTMTTQMMLSTVSAFSILLFMDIRVSQIPLEAYPFVVLVMGVQNSFRLLRAVIQSDPERTASDRIADALGSVGYLSVLDMVQNLLILRFFYTVLNPGLSVFCVFAGLCVILDLFYHFAYFLPSLCNSLRSVDLGELLHHPAPPRDDANDAAVLGQLTQESPPEALAQIPFGFPSPGRLLGTLLLIGFVLLLNQHFTSGSYLFPLTRGSYMNAGLDVPQDSISMLHQARRPASWLELQDQETARDLIDIFRPGVHALIIRFHDPIILIRKGADRLQAAKSLPHRQSSAVAPLIIVLLVAVALWLWYLDRNAPDVDQHLQETSSESLRVRSPPGAHGLDILDLAASATGMVVSVGLDHRIRVWDLKHPGGPSESEELPPDCDGEVLWPVMAVAVDGVDRLVAILTATGTFCIWDIDGRHFSFSVVSSVKKRPCSFFFPRKATSQGLISSTLCIVEPDGVLTEVVIEKRALNRHKICAGPVIDSAPVHSKRLPLRLVTLNAEGHAYVTSKHATNWTSENSAFRDLNSKPIGVMNGFWPLPTLGLMGIAIGVQSDEVFLVDLQSHIAIRKFNTGWIKTSTLRAIHSPRRSCPRCGVTSVESFSIIYAEEASGGGGDLRMHTFVADEARRDTNPWICFRAERDPRERHCAGFDKVDELRHRMASPGTWQSTNSNRVAGIRSSATRRTGYGSLRGRSGRSTSRDHSDDDDVQIRMRRPPSEAHQSHDDRNSWEAWTMDPFGKVDTRPIASSTGFDEPSLFVSKIGAITPVGQHSLVAALGVSIKLLMLRPERFDDDENEPQPRRSLDHHGRGTVHRTKPRSRPAAEHKSASRSAT